MLVSRVLNLTIISASSPWVHVVSGGSPYPAGASGLASSAANSCWHACLKPSVWGHHLHTQAQSAAESLAGHILGRYAYPVGGALELQTQEQQSCKEVPSLVSLDRPSAL